MIASRPNASTVRLIRFIVHFVNGDFRLTENNKEGKAYG